MLHKILQLGFSPGLFSEFDDNVPSEGRSAHKAERIGKKYQWIAYDELHARISDNFYLAEKPYSSVDETEWRDGTWQNSFRDIDPSLLITETPHDGWAVNQKSWWTPHGYDSWNSAKTQREWLLSTHDLPEPKDFLLLPKDNDHWLALNSYAHWKHKESVGSFSGNETESQEIHYIFRSYLIRNSDLESMVEWVRKQDWINDRLPSPGHSYHVHLNEHFWAPSFSGAPDDDWITRLYQDNDLPCPFVETTHEYLCEDRSYDCSMDKTINILMPSRWLATKMGLEITGRRADFHDKKGQLIAFDPSTRDSGHGALLIQRKSFIEFLKREGLTIFWTLLAEKNIYPPERLKRWPGRLTILGIYWLANDKIEGDFRTEFCEGHNH